ncbi:hypothetical protein BJ994_000733 [Arthrobacter pigmenti]|uniref:Integral membrane protein n=1 Tax=Arthrobacter pigmenti TaxID=271432 RepID=A0A846RND5_9MICC|nr:DUF6350 family protein [Arthrobacter pigmenti]NJC21657.1 hypothetical protein [Arthrobacter pigmenti]
MRLPTKPRAVPMPLWLQGAFELGQAAVVSALVVVIPLAGVWLTGGFAAREALGTLRLAAQAWLVIHGVPLEITLPDGGTGTLWAVPLALTLLPFLLAWRAGRRLARASYTDQLWQALLGALVVYAAFGFGAAFLADDGATSASPAAGASVPLIASGLGMIIGAYQEAGSWGRLIGVDLADWISTTSQHSRWAGSYVWSALRASFLAVVAALGLAALLLAVTLAIHWASIATIYERLDAGIVGGAVVTIGQLGFLPNLAIWTLSWSSGAGFALGTGSSITPLATTAGPLPAIPILGAVPSGTLDYGMAALALPVVAGVLAGLWFFREGENHFDEWLQLKTHARWFTATASTLTLGAFIGVMAGLGAAVLALLSGASAGIGRFVELGPDPLWTGLWVAAEVAVGVVVGFAAGPLLERENR